MHGVRMANLQDGLQLPAAAAQRGGVQDRGAHRGVHRHGGLSQWEKLQVGFSGSMHSTQE